ncbi:MAG: hypothetical protein QOH93_318, partial [Chloroflexia bacterium]|nr:hypothetical protein [Chloroflexia bacterium]
MFSYLDWHNPIYLRRGSNLQRRAAAILHSLGIFSTLAQYDPVLAGTIPLDLALDDSDLDIICEVHDLEQFANLLISNYSHLAGFRIK